MPAAIGAPAASAALPKSGQFDEVSTISASRLTVKITKTVTFKGNNYRIDSRRIDLIPYSRILDNGTIYSYLPDEQAAMRMPAADQEPSLPDQLLAQKEQVEHDGTRSGADTVDGFACEIYSQPAPSGEDATIRVWVSKDPRFPFIVKTLSIDHKQGVTDTEEIANVKLNAPISDTVFALPKDTKIMDAPTNGASGDNGASGGPAPPDSGQGTAPAPSGAAPAPSEGPAAGK